MSGVLWFVAWALLFIAPFAAIIDIVPRPAEQFADSGEPKSTWLGALIIGTLFCGFFGSGLGVYYFVKVRPDLPDKAAPTA